MDLTIPDIGSAGLMALIILLTTIIGFIKGLVRMIFGFVALMIGGLGAYWGCQRGGAMLNGYFPDPPSWLPAAVAVIMGLALFVISRTIFSYALKPIKLVEGKKKNLAFPGGILGIFTGIAFLWLMLSGIRYVGTLAEIARLDRAIGKEKVEDVPVSPLIVAKRFLDKSIPGQFHRKFDLMNDHPRAQLAKLRVLAQEQHAVYLAASKRDVYDALAQPDIRKILGTTPELEMAYLDSKRWSHLLESQRLRKVASMPAAREVLEAADIEKALGITPAPLFPEPASGKGSSKEKTTAKK